MTRVLPWILLGAAACSVSSRSSGDGDEHGLDFGSTGFAEDSDVGSTGLEETGSDGGTGSGTTTIPSGCDGSRVPDAAARLSAMPWVPECYESPAGESIDMVADGDTETKFVVRASSTAIRYDTGVPHILTRYAITSANDFPERDPVRWIVYGSNDGKTWTPLDTRTGEDFAARFERREFTVENCRAYRHYLLRIENEAGGLTQLSELELYGASPYAGEETAAPAAASGLSATTLSRHQVDLQWVDGSDDERFFRIEQSTDGQSFVPVGYVRVDETRFSVVDLEPGSAYSFRVVAVNAAGDAAPSNVAAATTASPLTGAAQGDGSTRYTENGYSLTTRQLDSTTPQWFIDGVVEQFFLTYPQMSATYHPDGPRNVRVDFDPNEEAAAAIYTSEARIVMSSNWAKDQDAEGVHVIVRAGFGVIQDYPGYGSERSPVWITEGLADLAAYDFMTSKPITCWALPHYEPSQDYTNGFRVVARFLVWLRETYGEALILELDETLRSGQYNTSTFWNSHTSKSIDELWSEYAASPHEPLPYE